MKTKLTFIFDNDISPESKVNAVSDFIDGCRKSLHFLEVGTQLTGVLFDPSINKGFYRVGEWSIDTLES